MSVGTDVASAALDLNYGGSSALSVPTALALALPTSTATATPAAPTNTATGSTGTTTPFSFLTDPAAAESKIRALEANLRDKEGAMRGLNLSTSTSTVDFDNNPHGTGGAGGGLGFNDYDPDALPEVLGSALDVDLAATDSGIDADTPPNTAATTTQAASQQAQQFVAADRASSTGSYTPAGGPPTNNPPASDISNASLASQTAWEPLIAALRSTLSSRDDRLHRTIGLIESLAREMEELNAKLAAGKENEDRLVRSHRVLRTVYQARVDGLKSRADKLAIEAEENKKAAEKAREELNMATAAAAAASAASLAASQQQQPQIPPADYQRLQLEKQQLSQRALDLEKALELALLQAKEASEQAELAQKEARALAAAAVLTQSQQSHSQPPQPTLVQGPPISEPLGSNLTSQPSQTSVLSARAISPPQDFPPSNLQLNPTSISTRSIQAQVSQAEEFPMEVGTDELAYWREQARLAEKGVGITPVFDRAPVVLPIAAASVAANNNNNDSTVQLDSAPAKATPLTDPEAGIRELATSGSKLLFVKSLSGSAKRTVKKARLVPRGREVPLLVIQGEGGLFGSGKEESGASFLFFSFFSFSSFSIPLTPVLFSFPFSKYSVPIAQITTTRDPTSGSLLLSFHPPSSQPLLFQPLSTRELGLWLRSTRLLLKQAGIEEKREEFKVGLARYDGTAGGVGGVMGSGWGKVERWALELA